MKIESLKAFLSIIAIMGILATGAQAAGDEAAARKLKVSISSPAAGKSVISPVRLVGKVSGGVPPYTYKWAIPGGTPNSFTRKTSSTQNGVKVSYPPRNCTIRLTVIDSKRKRAVVRRKFAIIPDTRKSINSTSQNRDTLPTAAVAEQPYLDQAAYRIISVNDLGMHCGDLDHRVASILPPFNVLHAQVFRRGTTTLDPPTILTALDVDVFYSAASNPNDPVLQTQPSAPVYKTNFWDPNPRPPGHSLAFDAYDPFYPPGVLSLFPLTLDTGLPAPDLAMLYPLNGLPGKLEAAQQEMPGTTASYAANTPQLFSRFDTDFPFFVGFPFGYWLTLRSWFAADGIPVAPFDDAGRKNSFPLMRVQAKSKTGATLASVDTVLPVSAESDCWRCHTSSVDGGNGQAACLPAFDDIAGCTEAGSLRSPARFLVAQAADDTSTLPLEVKREWASDNNILRLHDTKHPLAVRLQDSTPVVCQKCHYTPALDLAHFGPLGPGDAKANGRDQRVHPTNSRVIHTFHAQFTDLFKNDMPAPTDSRRTDPVTGKPVVNLFVQGKLNESCYQCHPGRDTKCLRGNMFTSGLICQDCHGGMLQVGNDFSEKFSVATPFGDPGSTDLTKRIPWANMPACQSCHTGDVLDNLAADPNVLRSPLCNPADNATDCIRLLQAYRTNDTANAKPIVATNKRFAENSATRTDGNETVVLYRLSKETHMSVLCEACHGSTHAEWPVQPESGAIIANDNMAAIKLQGHTGRIVECTTCHDVGALPVRGPTALNGPHGMHVVNDPSWMSGSHGGLVSTCPNADPDSCRACHGLLGEGSVLSKLTITRNDKLIQGHPVTCTNCHPWNPLDPTNTVALPQHVVCP
jgi:hypothetical protein